MSYANVAANGSSPTSEAPKIHDASLSTSSQVPSQPQSSETENSEKNDLTTKNESESEATGTAETTATDSQSSPVSSPSATKKERKTLAPAPVPSKSAWGASTPTPTTSVDDSKWPTPDKVQHLQQSQPSNKATTKFIKPNKWVPINAKVILPSPRGHGAGFGQHKNKRKNKNSRKKTPSGTSADDPNVKKDDLKDSSDVSEQVNSTSSVQSFSELQNGQAIGSDLEQQAQQEGSFQGEGYNKAKYYGQGSTPGQKPFRKFLQNGSQQNYRPSSLIQQPRQLNGQTSPYAQNSGYYNYNGNRQYRPNGNGGQYRRNNSSGNINAYSNGYRAPMSMPFIPHIPHHPLPQGMIPGVPYGAPVPVQIPPPISPKQDPLHALTQQIDYYFSLENLIRDVFLRKNMGTEGWIELDLILNFKRVKIITNSIQNAIEEADEEKKAQELDNAIMKAVQKCENVELGYLNGKDHNTATATEVQLRVKHNFEQWLLPDNLKL